jgi:hypothetical protein
MYRAFEAARTTSTVRGAFMHAGITYTKHDESDILGCKEGKVRNAPAFKEVWEANFLRDN